MVDLRADGDKVRKLWRGSEALHVPLSLAAALAFHESYGGPDAIMQRLDYDDALDLIAAALSRLVTIYKVDESTRSPVSVQLNLGSGKFRHGATVYEYRNGRALGSLMVQRAHVPAAVELIKAVGIPFQIGSGASALTLSAR